MLLSPVKPFGGRRLCHRLIPAFAALLSVASTVSASGPRPAGAGESGIPSLAPGRSRQNHFLLRAEINGKPALLGVDTGAPVSAISAARRKHFGMSAIPGSSKLPPRLRINGGFNRVTIAHHLRLGALILVDEPMVAIDLSAPARAAREFHEQELDGILGADILFPTQAVLDCRKQILFMKLDPDARGTVPGINHRGWKTMPIRVTKGWNLYVDSNLNGKPAQLMIDTGAFTTLIHRPFVREMQLRTRDTPYTSGAVNLDERAFNLRSSAASRSGRFW